MGALLETQACRAHSPGIQQWEGSGEGAAGPWDGALLKGSWDLVTRVIIRVTVLVVAYNPN